MVTLKALIVTVPDELREQLQSLPKMTLIDRCAGLRPGTVTSVLASAKRSLRSLARRWLALDEEIKDHDRLLGGLTRQQAPDLMYGPMSGLRTRPDQARGAEGQLATGRACRPPDSCGAAAPPGPRLLES